MAGYSRGGRGKSSKSGRFRTGKIIPYMILTRRGSPWDQHGATGGCSTRGAILGTARSPSKRPYERVSVPRRVKDFIEISDYTSLDQLIRYLETIRDNLPADHEAELQIRGDDVFGRRLTITYFREQTPDEVALEERYAGFDGAGAEIEDLRHQLDSVPFKSAGKRR